MRWIVDEWKHLWKSFSVWALLLIGAAPDIYSGVAALGWLDDEGVPPAFIWTLRILAALGIAGRFVKQRQSLKVPPQ